MFHDLLERFEIDVVIDVEGGLKKTGDGLVRQTKGFVLVFRLGLPRLRVGRLRFSLESLPFCFRGTSSRSCCALRLDSGPLGLRSRALDRGLSCSTFPPHPRCPSIREPLLVLDFCEEPTPACQSAPFRRSPSSALMPNRVRRVILGES
ncbi:hypothetical protein BIU97_12100 [Curtobacterium sp. MCBA15_009]|nr:hypothetical protein BIU97_12100 [Curtobacterium sp. MCBA15_009]